MKIIVNGIDLKLDGRCLSNYVKNHIIGIESDYTYKFKLLKTNKMKNYEITEEQIKQLAKGNAKVKELFPEVFEAKFEIGKWYKNTEFGSAIFCITRIFEKDFDAYGFNFKGEWRDNKDFGRIREGIKPATDTEVLKALTNEAIKRGFKEGVFITRSFDALLKDSLIDLNKFPQDKKFHYDIEQDYYDIEQDYLEMHGFVIYSKGQWAEIVKTYTKEEAEKLLNAKII